MNNHEQQVPPDRSPVAALNNRHETKVATWTVRTLYQFGKFEKLQREAMKCNITIMEISKMRWKGGGNITTGNHTFIYSGEELSERGLVMLIGQQQLSV